MFHTMKHIFMFVLFSMVGLSIMPSDCRQIKNPNLGFNIDTICNDIKTSLSNNEWAEITIIYENDDTGKKILFSKNNELRIITDNISNR